MYKVLDKSFNSFDDVVRYAWSTYKIEMYCEADTEEDKQEACKLLERHVMFIERIGWN